MIEDQLKLTLFFILTFLIVIISNNANSKTIEEIQARGELVVGVKSDYKPWGMVSSTGELIGFEPDLAKDISDRLNVSLKLVPVTTSNRLNKLEEGIIDLVIATMGDTEERRQLSGIIEPHYYASGVRVLMHKDNNTANTWADFRNRPICLTAGSYVNREVIQRFLIEPVILSGTRDPARALENGQCVGWAYDDTKLAQLLQDGDRWKDYYMPLETVMPVPWALAVSKISSKQDFGFFVSNVVAEWHRKGFLLEKEAEWNIPESKFLRDQYELWNKKDDNGNYLCNRLLNGKFPINCLDKAIIASSERSAEVYGAGISVFLKNSKFNFPPLYDDYILEQIVKGGYITVILAISSIAGSLLFLIIFGGLYIKSNKVFRKVIGSFGSLFRATPPILNLYLVFFGIGAIVSNRYGFTLDALIVSIFVFSFYAGAGNLFVFSSAYDKNELELTDASSSDKIRISIAQSFGGIEAICVNIVKAVAMASVIAVPELVAVINTIIHEYGSASEMMLFLLLFYFIIVYLFIILLKLLNEWVQLWLYKNI